MDEIPSDRDKDISDNDDRPPPSRGKPIQWDFIRFGLRPRSMDTILDVGSDKWMQCCGHSSHKLVVLASTKV